jgi:glycosyltransferase involved in cell wall biosynthesis
MKIAVVSGGHVPSQWAHSIAVMKNADGFADCGHDVTVFTVERLHERRNRRTTADVHEHYGVDPSIDIEWVTDRTPFYFQDVRGVGFVLDGLRYVTRDRVRWVGDPVERIADRIADKGFDLCYSRSYRGARYCVERGVPTVLETHARRTRIPDRDHAFARTDADAFRAVVTISDRLKQRFVNGGVPAEKVVVLQDGVDLDQFATAPEQSAAREETGLPPDEDIVAYVGSLFADKGIDEILAVADRLPEALVVLVGGREAQVTEWREFAAEHGVENVRFEGFVDHSAVPTYLAAADVLVMPYRTDREVSLMDIETTSPLKLFEYMASGRPIVSTDIPAIARTVDHGETALLAPPNDTAAFARYVQRLLDDPELAAGIGTAARKAVGSYSWARRCERIVDAAMH